MDELEVASAVGSLRREVVYLHEVHAALPCNVEMTLLEVQRHLVSLTRRGFLLQLSSSQFARTAEVPCLAPP